ncbi:MAG: hypothetical protein GXP18_10970 [Gammaproteobacteria bacterium]|nr:hypothetical protein [Gammaproteobacteria bacterium]
MINLAASYPFSETVELTGRIVNLFDETCQEVIGYGTSERAYYAGLRVNL